MKKITFKLPAEALGTATAALLLGDFNGWNYENAVSLTVQADGSLAASVELEAGKSYEYRFLLNNGTWINDWAADKYVHNEAFGVENSVVIVPAETAKPTAKKAKPAVTKEKKEAAPKVAATPKETVAKKAAPSKAKKEKVVVPAKDDLTKIEGIGTKIAKLLEADGIVTFADLGKATGKKLKAILEAAGPKFQLHDPASWPKQAKLAAAAKWDELAALQEKLIGGK